MRRYRMLVSSFILVVAAAATGATGSPVRAGVPSGDQTTFWQQMCEGPAQGTVSQQEAMVCIHSGFPQWDARDLRHLQGACERSLDGTFEYRSEYPYEYAACFV